MDGEGGGSPELALYNSRARRIGTQVIGREFYLLVEEQIPRTADPEAELVERQYCRAFDLFREGCDRVRRQPQEYQQLVTWKNEVTLHGRGHPGLREALLEEYIGFSEEYAPYLGQLARRHRSLGNHAEAEECDHQLRQLDELGEAIRTLNTLD